MSNIISGVPVEFGQKTPWSINDYHHGLHCPEMLISEESVEIVLKFVKNLSITREFLGFSNN